MISIKKRIVVGVVCFIALVVACSAYISLRTAFSQEQENLTQQVHKTVELARSNPDNAAVLDKLSDLMEVRLSVIRQDGAAMYDSGEDKLDFFTQEEVIAADQNGSGEVTLYNFLSGEVEIRYAVKLKSERILRVVCQRSVFRYASWGVFGAFVLGILLLGLLFALFIARQVMRPIEYISGVAENLANGTATIEPKMFNYQETHQLMCTMQNMNTRLKETIDELKRRSVELESIINSMNNGLIAVDGRLRVVRMNQAARKMLGVTGPVEGKMLLEASGNAKLEASLKAAMEKDELTQVELPVRAEPRHRLLRAYISGLEHDGGAIGAVALLEDITQLRHLEEMRTDFAANVTHELKTPLTSIKGFVETLQAGAVDDPEMARKFLDIISAEADRLYRLINDILSLSSMESGRVRVPTERLDLSQLARETCLFLKSAAENKNIAVHVDEGQNTFIDANKDHVRQLLINLIDNAIKYTLNDGEVFVSTERREDTVRLRVRDTGIGIPKEHIPRLFERFYRVDKGRSRNMGGTGLGLAIVKHIVMDMGGSIQVESEPGEGTEFIVDLPYAPNEK